MRQGRKGDAGQAVRRGAQAGRADAGAAPRRRRAVPRPDDRAPRRRAQARRGRRRTTTSARRRRTSCSRARSSRADIPRRRCPRRGARRRWPICPRRTSRSAKVLEATNKLDQAIAEYNLARRPPVEGEAQLGRARILVRMGATKDALAELARWRRDPKLRAQALLLTGDCYADLQQADRARQRLRGRGARRRPTSGDAAFKLGRALPRRRPAPRHHRRSSSRRSSSAATRRRTRPRPCSCSATPIARATRTTRAVQARTRSYLELAPADAPARGEVQKHISILGGGCMDFPAACKRLQSARRGWRARSARIFKNDRDSPRRWASARCSRCQDRARRAARRQGRRGDHPPARARRSAAAGARRRRRAPELRRARGARQSADPRPARARHRPRRAHRRVPLQRPRVPRARRRRSTALGGASVNDRLSAQGGRGRLHPRELGRARDAVPRRSRARRRGGAARCVKSGNIARERCIARGGAPGFRSYEELLAARRSRARRRRVEGGGYGGVMIYTSGTTGRAKGATRDFRRMGMEPVLDFIVAASRCAATSATSSSARSITRRRRRSSTHDAHGRRLQRHRCATSIPRRCCAPSSASASPRSLMVPTMLARHRRARPARRCASTTPRRCAGSCRARRRCRPSSRAASRTRSGPILYNFYGATETGLVTIALPGEHTARPGTIGRAHPRQRDPPPRRRRARGAASAQVGELYVRNAHADGRLPQQRRGDRRGHARRLLLRRRSRPIATPTATTISPIARPTW